MIEAIVSACICVVLVLVTTAIHFRAVIVLDRLRASELRAQHRRLFAAIIALIGAHLAEIGLYAVAFFAGERMLGLGVFDGVRSMTGFDYFYFAAETYSTLGYGDIYPTGALRMIASICALNGLLMLAWSGAFLVALAQDLQRKP